MRGKYAARAALRREDTGVRSEIESYQHHVKRLTAENEKLNAALATERAEHRHEIRQLKAQLDEGLSPELVTLREELERQRQRAAQALDGARKHDDKYNKLLTFAAALLHNLTGCTGLEATERIILAITGKPITVADPKTGATIKNGRAGPVDAETLQRNRGWRSSPKVVEHLDAVIEAARLETRQKRQSSRREP